MPNQLNNAEKFLFIGVVYPFRNNYVNLIKMQIPILLL